MHLVKYYMDLCQPCKELEGVLSGIDLGDITYESLNIYDQDRLELTNLKVRGAPTCILYEDATKQVELRRFTGSTSRKNLMVWLGLEEPT